VRQKSKNGKTRDRVRFVRFRLGENTYEIDPDRQKVYRRFVEVEAAKAAAIYSTWRSQHLEG
jgi:hypothetical protein